MFHQFVYYFSKMLKYCDLKVILFYTYKIIIGKNIKFCYIESFEEVYKPKYLSATLVYVLHFSGFLNQARSHASLRGLD